MRETEIWKERDSGRVCERERKRRGEGEEIRRERVRKETKKQ